MNKQWHAVEYRVWGRYRVRRFTYANFAGAWYRLDSKRFWTLKGAQARADELNAIKGANHG